MVVLIKVKFGHIKWLTNYAQITMETESDQQIDKSTVNVGSSQTNTSQLVCVLYSELLTLKRYWTAITKKLAFLSVELIAVSLICLKAAVKHVSFLC